MPGPGQYQPLDAFVKERVISHKMTKSERVDIVSREFASKPGPGTYESPHKTMGKGSFAALITGRPQDLQKNEIPGPGNYEADSSIIKDRVKTYKMEGGSSRGDIVSREAKNLPGPGAYTHNYKEIGTDGQVFEMRGRPKESLGN